MREVTQPVRARGTMPSAVAVVAALAALLAFAPVASATSDPLASGTTTLTVKKGFKKKLNRKKIKLLKWGSGKVKNRNVTLAVTGGSLDPTTGEGTTEQGGGFKFRYRKRTVPITELTIDRTGKAAYAKVANARMKLGFLGKYSYAREGFGVNVNAGKLKLTGKAARRINNKLGMKKQKPFKGGNVISNAYSETQPKTVAVLPTGNATLDLSASAALKLNNVGPQPEFPKPGPFAVKLAPVAPTSVLSAGPPPTLGFPIGGGTMSPTATAGTLQTLGGLTLTQSLEAAPPPGTKGVTVLTMKDIWVDMATKVATVEVSIENPKTPEANLGNLGRSSIADIILTGAVVSSDPTARTVSVLNASATLQAVTAETLNSVFITPIEKATGEPQEKFAAGDPLGNFSFTATTQ